MIKSFKHKGLEVFYRTGSTKGIQAMHAQRLRKLLFMLEAMTSVNDLKFLR